MDYKSGFLASCLEMVKIQVTYDNRQTGASKTTVFTGKYGIECLLYVED